MSENPDLALALLSLPLHHRIAFAASCCERMLPNYHAFAVMEDCGDVAKVNEALEMLWQFASTGKLNVEETLQTISACEGFLPDSEEYLSLFTGSAINAIAALIHSLRSSMDGDCERVAQVAQLVVDTNDEYLYIVNTPGINVYQATPEFDTWIKNSPLMVAELEKQQQDIQVLQRSSTLTEKILDDLRTSSRTVGIHPIRRGLIRII